MDINENKGSYWRADLLPALRGEAFGIVKKILEKRVVKASPDRLTPAYEKFDGIDYAPANKYVLYGHHFAVIAGAGPITGPAIAMVWGWGLPLLWVLADNILIGAVHDYMAIMASVRHGGLSVMSVSENIMGRKAKYIFLTYVWFALVLVLAAFLSVASSTFVSTPTAAIIAIIFMPLALSFGILVYRTGLSVKLATGIALIILVIAFFYSMRTPLYLTYEAWIVVLTLYSMLAAALPVWYLLQPRDYLNAYLLWVFAGLAILAALIIPDLLLTGPVYTGFAAVSWWMVVHWLLCSFMLSLSAVHLSTACSSPAPPTGACLQQLPAVHPAPCSEAECTRCPPRHAHRVHPYFNTIIYVKILSFSAVDYNGGGLPEEYY
ncbi:MAG: carbon starvation CstA family protein [Fervidicoccaceae archaeon]